MRITKCDICKKQIKDERDSVYVNWGWRANHEICQSCGRPVLNFLFKHKLEDKKKLDATAK